MENSSKVITIQIIILQSSINGKVQKGDYLLAQILSLLICQLCLCGLIVSTYSILSLVSTIYHLLLLHLLHVRPGTNLHLNIYPSDKNKDKRTIMSTQYSKQPTKLANLHGLASYSTMALMGPYCIPGCWFLLPTPQIWALGSSSNISSRGLLLLPGIFFLWLWP